MTDKSQAATLTIATQSQVIHWSPNQPHFPPAKPPSIAINGNPIVPAQSPSSPTGFQIVILDSAQNPNNPSAILFNRYEGVLPPVPGNSNNWMSTYDYMYKRLRRDILITGNIEQQILILASFGLDRNMTPDTDALGILLNYGSGKQLQLWETTADIGSQTGGSSSWVTFPTNYILVGSSDLGYNLGTEVYATSNQDPVHSKITVPLGAGAATPGAKQAAK